MLLEAHPVEDTTALVYTALVSLRLLPHQQRRSARPRQATPDALALS
jgi:hypothetical protein